MSDTKKTAAAAEAASLQEDMDAVMRKYDRESATRIWAGKPKIVISVVMALFSVYCIWSTLFSTAALEVRLTAFLGLIIIMGYLTYPVSKKHVHVNPCRGMTSSSWSSARLHFSTTCHSAGRADQ